MVIHVQSIFKDYCCFLRAPKVVTQKRRGMDMAADGQAATEQAFRKMRRADVAARALAVSADVVEATAREGSGAQWSASALDEDAWQQNRQYKARVQAYLQGSLVASEVDDELVAVAQAYKDLEAEADAKRLRREAKADDMLRPVLIRPQAHPYYVSDASFAALPGVDASNAVQDIFLASTFVVQDPANPPEPVLWRAMLLGGYLADKDSLMTDGRGGVVFHCAACLASKRKVYVSDDFRAQAADLFRIVSRALDDPACKWRRLSSWEDFSDASVQACGDHVQNKRWYEVVALASTTEAAALEMRNVFDRESFVGFMLKQSVAKKGFGGR